MSETRAESGLRQLNFSQSVIRGLSLRCPTCGHGALFGSFFRMNVACSECGYRFERAAGYFLGSTYINYGVTALVTTISYVTLYFGFGWPKETLLPGLLLFCSVFPLVFFRFARSMWLSFDCYFDRTGAAEALPKAGVSDSKK